MPAVIDIALEEAIEEEGFDLFIENSDLASEPGLRTAVIISLFSDARVDSTEIPDGEINPRGWWGDAFSQNTGDSTGSKLWLLARQKATQDVLSSAGEYAKAALRWLVDDGVAASVDATAQYSATGTLLISVTITRPGQQPIKFLFGEAWTGEASR